MARGKFRKRQTLRKRFAHQRQGKRDLAVMTHNVTLLLGKVRLLREEIAVHKSYDPDFAFTRETNGE